MISNIKRNEINEIFTLTQLQKQILSDESLRIRYAANYAHANCKTIIEIDQIREVKFLDVLMKNYENVFNFHVIQSEGPNC